MKILYFPIALTASLLCSALSLKAQNIKPIDSLRVDLQSILDNATANYGMDGLELSMIIEDNSPTETFYSGLRAPGIAVDTAKPWHYASATTLYITYLALKMVDQGMITLNDSIGQHMDAASLGLDGGITVRQLLTHTSILEEFWQPGQTVGCYNDIWVQNPGQLGCPVDLISCFPPNKSTPGSYDRNNTNALVLQFLIDSLAGQSYEVEIQNQIFAPLGITESYLSSCKTITIDSINGIWTTASGYDNSQDYTRYFSTNGGNRGLISKSYEVAKFYRMLFKDQLLPSSLMDSVKTIIPGSEAPQGAYSCATDILGYSGYNTDIIRIIDVAGDTAWLYGKGGFGMNGHLTMHWPEKDWTFSFVQNDRSREVEQRNLSIDLYCYLKDIDSISISTFGTTTFNTKSDLNAYPNPCVNFLNIDLPNSELIKSYKIINSRGSMISEGANTSSNQINTGNLKPGLYWAIIESDDSLYRVKFQKVK